MTFVSSNRVKEYIFSNVGSLTAPATGVIAAQYSEYGLNGEILGVHIGTTNWTNTGSLQILSSGTRNHVIGTIRSVAQGAFYFSSATLLPTGAASTLTETRPISVGPIYVIGSGLGDSKSGTALSVLYR